LNQNWIVENLNNAFSTWNGKLTELWGLVTTSPQTFKGGAVWGVMQSLHNAMIGIGYALIVLFFAISLFKNTANFHELKRPEAAVHYLIRFVAAKTLVGYGMDIIPINKDIRRYQEEIFMGLTLRQLLCSGIAIGLAVLIYLWAKPLLGQETASWLCILAAAPIAAAGFLSYDGLPFEKFVIIVLESTILCSGWRVWKTELHPKHKSKGKVKKIAFK
jgi:hypothetical protein